MSNVSKAQSAATVILPLFIMAHFTHHLATGSLTPLMRSDALIASSDHFHQAGYDVHLK